MAQLKSDSTVRTNDGLPFTIAQKFEEYGDIPDDEQGLFIVEEDESVVIRYE